VKTGTETEKTQKINKRGAAALALDLIKTVLIYMLTASMLISAGYYINERQNAGQVEEIPLDKMPILKSGGTFFAAINENHVNPVQITVTVKNNSFTAVYNDKLISDIYESDIDEMNLKNNVRGLFGMESKCRKLEKEEGERLWKKCAEKENSVYIKYAGNYIYPVLYAFWDKTWDTRNDADAFSNELVMVHELFIADENPVYGITRDMDGNVAVFEPDQKTKETVKSYINNGNPAAYNDIAGVIPCEFLKGADINEMAGVNKNNIKNLKFPEDLQLFRHYNIYTNELELSNPLLGENGRIDTDKSFIKDLFKIFSFNAEGARSYAGEDGIMFVDGKNTIRFYNDGQILYTYKPAESNIGGMIPNSNEGGIRLLKFLGYDADLYASYEKIKAASAFVNSLSGELTGNGCDLYLKNITADSDRNLRIVFSYYYNGIKIKIGGTDEAVILTIGGNSITEVKIHSFYVNSKDTIMPINPILELKVIDSMISAAKTANDNDMQSGGDDDGGGDEMIENNENNEADKADEPDELEESDENGESDENNGGEEEIAEETAGKYQLRYDKIQDKLIVNGFELVYNIKYNDTKNIQASWEIK